MSDLDHDEDRDRASGIDNDLQQRLTQQTITRSLRPVDLAEEAAVVPPVRTPSEPAEGDAGGQPDEEPDDISEEATIDLVRSAEPDQSISSAQTMDAPGVSISDAQTMDGPRREGGGAQGRGQDSRSVALPRHMGNWQELTLLPLPEDPDGVIGAGGQATIYSYVQRELGRDVAVKALRPEGRHYEAIEDLMREACVTARLEHPNIVPVHYLHLPEHDRDAPYWVMKRIHGKALTAHLPGDEDPWSIDRLLDVFHRILDAMAFAHSRGIVHRDLKPDNVLVGAFGEVQVTDWGLAVAVTEEGARGAKPVVEADAAATGGEAPDQTDRSPTSQELSGEIAKLNADVRSGTIGALLKSSSGGRAGTPVYMAPEQLDLSADNIDERTDVFLLGGILYAMLTGSPPHDLSGLKGAEEMFGAIRSCSTLVPPEERREEKGWDACPEGLSPIAAHGLSAITMKALSREPEERHASVEVLVGALNTWESESASAELTAEAQSRLTETESARRPSARAYAEVIALADAALERVKGNALAQQTRDRASAALAAIQRRSARRFWTAAAAIVLVFVVGAIGYQRTRAQWTRAEKQKAKAERLAAAEVEQRKQADAAKEKAEAERKRADIERDKALLEAYFATIGLAEQKIRDAQIGDAEKRLDACPEQLRAWEWRHLKRLCHLDLLTLKGHSSGVMSVAFSPDGQHIASGGGDGIVTVWDAAKGHKLLTLNGHGSAVNAVAFSPDGQRIASGSRDKTAKVWDAASGRELVTLKGHRLAAQCVAFSPDGRSLAVGSRDLKAWDVASGRELFTVRGHVFRVQSIAFSSDGQRVVSGGHGGTVKVWDAGDGRLVATLKGHDAAVAAVALSSDGQRIASGSSDSTVKIWDAGNGRETVTFRGHGSSVHSVAFSPDDRRIASGGGDAVVRIWDAASGREQLALKGHGLRVLSVAFSPDGQRVASGGLDSTVKVWDATRAHEVVALRGHGETVHSVAFSPDGQCIASGGSDSIVKVWDTATSRELVTLRGHGRDVRSVAFSPEGHRVASGSADLTVKVWDVADGREILTLRGHSDEVASLAFNPDGQRLASASLDSTVKIWDPVEGREVLTLTGHDSPVLCVTFSPDGQRIASSSQDVKIWDAVEGRLLATLEGHGESVGCVTFSLDGQRLASGSSDTTVKVWDAGSGREIATLRGHGSSVSSVAFCPDGDRIVSASADKTVKLWSVAEGREVLTLRGHDGEVCSVAVSPDGQRLASGSRDCSVRIWDAAPALSPSRFLAGAARGEAIALYHLALIRESESNDAEARELHQRAAAVTTPAQAEWADRSRRRLKHIPWLRSWQAAYPRVVSCLESGDTEAGVKEYETSDWTAEARKRLADRFLGRLVQLADRARREKAHDTAERLYRWTIELDPATPSAHYYLGITLSAKGDDDGAIQQHRRAIESDADYGPSHRALARLLEKKGEYEEAIDYWQTYVSLAKRGDRLGQFAVHSYARLLLELDRKEDAIQKLRDWAEKRTQELAARTELAALLCSLELYQEAEQVLPPLLPTKRPRPKVLLVAALCSQALGKGGEASKHVRVATAGRKPTPQAKTATADLLELGLELRKPFEDLLRSDDVLRKRFDASLALGYTTLASRQAARDEKTEAAEACNAALKLAPDRADVQMAAGSAFQKLGMYDKSVLCRSRVVELEPERGTSHGNLGWALYLCGRYDDAMAASLRASELNPRLAYVHANVGLLHLLKREMDKAMPYYAKAAELGLRQIDRIAIGDLIDLLKKRPEAVEAHYALGFCYEKKGSKARARKHYQEYVAAAKEGKFVDLAKERIAVLSAVPSRNDR